MAPEAEAIRSRYVEQFFLFQFLFKNIDKINGAILYFYKYYLEIFRSALFWNSRPCFEIL